MKTLIIILAAGKGTRMKTAKSKVLAKACDTPLIEIVLKKAVDFFNNSSIICIVCSEDNINDIKPITEKYNSSNPSKNIKITTTIQQQRLGTGHAVKCAIESLAYEDKLNFDKVCVLYGDSPLFEEQTLNSIVNNDAKISFGCFYEDNPSLQYGRIITDGNDNIKQIIEFKDATAEQRKINLFNSGLVGGDFKTLSSLVYKLDNKNIQNEFYLTDIAKLCNNTNIDCGYIICKKEESLGVNTMQELSVVEDIIQQQIRLKMMQNGVRLVDPKSVFFSFDTKIASDVTIEPNVVFKGRVEILSGTVIKSFCYIENSFIDENCSIGPFARFREKNIISKNCKIGNFVEVKASKLSSHVKAGHLAYIGDCEIGEETNIGAGAVFCNYDGKHKHKTKVGKNVFIGSNSSIIAPTELADEVFIAAGSVYDSKVMLQKNDLYIERSQPKVVKNFKIK